MEEEDMQEGQEDLDKIEKKLDDHIVEYKAHLIEEARREEMHRKAQEHNTKNIQELTDAVKPLVEAWTAASVFQRFIKWAASFAIIGAALKWFADKLPF